MKAPEVKPELKLSGEDGNANSIIFRARRALRRAGADGEYIKQYTDEATSSDYDNVLQTTIKYCEVI